jgi:zinc D-Ala-D-Ala carboxypeptidase
MQLSPNFTLAELTKSQTAARMGLDNTPEPGHIFNLQQLCEEVLQPARDYFGPIIVTSGYRSEALNAAIGGAPGSEHSKGCAADIEAVNASNLELAAWIAKHLSFNQLILEGYSPTNPSAGWVHVSFVAHCKNRKDQLTATFTNGRAQYAKVNLPDMFYATGGKFA